MTQIRKLISYCSDFIADCVQLEDSIKSILGYSAWDLGLELRGISITSNFCPTFPKVHSILFYVQHPGDNGRDIP